MAHQKRYSTNERNMVSDKKWCVIAVAALYLLSGILLIRSPISLPPFVESVWRFYSSIGFDMSRDIARAVILSLSLSCLAHALIILTTYITNRGLPKVLRGHEQYLFLRALFYLGLCILGIGAMGDNISARRTSSFSKELSILLGASILGGVVWTVSDLLASIILKFKR